MEKTPSSSHYLGGWCVPNLYLQCELEVRARYCCSFSQKHLHLFPLGNKIQDFEKNSQGQGMLWCGTNGLIQNCWIGLLPNDGKWFIYTLLIADRYVHTHIHIPSKVGSPNLSCLHCRTAAEPKTAIAVSHMAQHEAQDPVELISACPAPSHPTASLARLLLALSCPRTHPPQLLLALSSPGNYPAADPRTHWWWPSTNWPWTSSGAQPTQILTCWWWCAPVVSQHAELRIRLLLIFISNMPHLEIYSQYYSIFLTSPLYISHCFMLPYTVS